LPLENEFFNEKLKIENTEQQLLNNFFNLNDDFLIDFWKINNSISKKHILKLIKLLPYCYKISGNLELTKLSLEHILNKKVTIKKRYKAKQNKQEPIKLDSLKLGLNFTLESDVANLLNPVLEFEIGPIKENEIEHYTSKKGIPKLITIFFDYFTPIEYDSIVKFKIEQKNGFSLKQESKPILGLTTQL
ncbi:MAG: hypothetical protein ACPG6B_06165, partial [Oceanihabitans sp.]